MALMCSKVLKICTMIQLSRLTTNPICTDTINTTGSAAQMGQMAEQLTQYPRPVAPISLVLHPIQNWQPFSYLSQLLRVAYSNRPNKDCTYFLLLEVLDTLT